MKHIPDNYLVEWYIGVAKRRGWDEVVRLLKQYPKDEERMKELIKKKLGKAWVHGWWQRLVLFIFVQQSIVF